MLNKGTVCSYLVHLNNNIVPLTTLDVQDIRLVWDDWSVIGRNHLHFVIIKVHSIGSLSRTGDAR